VTAETYSGWAFSSPQSRAVEAELESIESPEILRGVISDLSLDKTWAERIFHQSDPLTTEEAQHYLESHLRPNFKHDSNIVEITALSDDPKEAAQIANEVVELYKVAHDPRAAAAAAPFVQDSTRATQSSAIKVTAPAEVPFEPTLPNKRLCYGLAAALGGMLSVMIASSIEICLLIARAEAAAVELQQGQKR
jgi:capsular polysaccharide biosynthesis protein